MKNLKLLLGTLALDCIPLAAQGQTVQGVKGAAHAVGLAEQLMSYKDAKGNGLYNIEIIEYITPHQPTSITHPKGVKGIQYSHPNDWVTAKNWYLNGGSSFGKIKNVPVFISGKGSHKVKLNLEFIKFGEPYRE